MGLFSNNKRLNWRKVKSTDEITNILKSETPTLIFKHSTRCAISSMALSQFESAWKVPENKCDLAFLDLINYRDVSNFIADKTGVTHQSPQVILIQNGIVLHHASHHSIDASKIETFLQNDKN